MQTSARMMFSPLGIGSPRYFRDRLNASWRPTAWLRMQSEAKRSRGRISLQFAICRDIFLNCRESRFISCEIPNNLNILGVVIPTQVAGSIFGYCREEQRGIADLAGWAQIPGSPSGAAAGHALSLAPLIWRQPRSDRSLGGKVAAHPWSDVHLSRSPGGTRRSPGLPGRT
jgi:hypothetical protein